MTHAPYGVEWWCSACLIANILLIIGNSVEESGLDAWKRLCERFDPVTAGRRRNLMQMILRPGEHHNEALRAKIEEWEGTIRKYENRKGLDGKRRKVDEELKMGIVSAMPKSTVIRDHLDTNLSTFKSYEDMKEAIFSFLEARESRSSAKGSQIRSSSQGFRVGTF